MAYYQARPVKNFPHETYRWCHVKRSPEGLRMGTIYDQIGDDLTEEEVAELRMYADDRRIIEIQEFKPVAK